MASVKNVHWPIREHGAPFDGQIAKANIAADGPLDDPGFSVYLGTFDPDIAVNELAVENRPVDHASAYIGRVNGRMFDNRIGNGRSGDLRRYDLGMPDAGVTGNTGFTIDIGFLAGFGSVEKAPAAILETEIGKVVH